MDQNVSLFPSVSTKTSGRTTATLQFALYYAAQGLRVFPLHSIRPTGGCTCGRTDCSSAGKHPVTRNGVKDATQDPAQIKTWWQQFLFANVGIATGNGLLVIDIDPRHGGSLEALKALVDLPETATVQTGGGGWHLYFLHPHDLTLRNTVSKLTEGIDTRSEGGYVVAPPSLHLQGQEYRWAEKKCAPVQAPIALLQRLASFSQGSSAQKQLVIPDTAEKSEEQGAQTLPVVDDESKGESPQAPAVPYKDSGQSQMIPEGKRNTTLVSLAGSLRHWGASEAMLFAAVQSINRDFCQPELSRREVRQICNSVSRWEQGKALQEGDEEGVSVGLQELKAVNVMLDQECPEPNWAIPGFLPEGLTLLAGKPKMGKSWLVLELALAIASGQPALGNLPTQAGHVLYLGLEDNQRRICDRIRKMLPHTEAPSEMTWGGIWSPLQEGGLRDLETWIKGVPNARLIIIDTLARVRPANGGGGSVYAEDYAVITPLKQLAEAHHVSILLVHHLRKNGASDPMDEISGSTGLTGATDCNMVLQRERGQHYAMLHITGRDVEEQTLNLKFNDETARWSIMDIPALAQMAPNRQAIYDLLSQEEQPLSAAEIAQRLNKDCGSIRKYLCYMKQDGLVEVVKRGKYKVIQKELISEEDEHVAVENA